MQTNFPAALVASVIALLAATSAHADISPAAVPPSTIDLKYSGAALGGYEQFYGSAGTGSYLAGSLKFDSKAPAVGSFASYCVELSQEASSRWNTYTLAAFNTKVGSSLARLYQVAGGSPTSKANSAAFQAAVWEIVYETGATYSLGSGTFQGHFSAANRAITTQAGTWLMAVNNFSGAELYKAQKYASGAAQDQLVITAVPEPETYAMLLAGLAMMGTVARRRKPR